MRTIRPPFVARLAAGLDAEYDSVPRFWSHQFDLKLQTIGLSLFHDATMLRGDPAEQRFSFIYLRAGRVVALDCVNVPRDYVRGRTLVERGVIANLVDLADLDIALKEIAARAVV